MVSMRTVVFGGTGFLGGRIVARLLKDGAEVRVAARHQHRWDFEHDGEDAGRLVLVSADLRDEATTAFAVETCTAARPCATAPPPPPA